MSYKESKVFENRDYLISQIDNEIQDISNDFQYDLITCYHTKSTCNEVNDLNKLIRNISITNPVPNDMKISFYLSEKYKELQQFKEIHQTTKQENEV